MKKLYGCCTIFSIMLMLIAGSAGASFTGAEKNVYGKDSQPGVKAQAPFVKASAALGDRNALPEGLTKAEWEKISTSIERDRYRLHKDERTGEYQALNQAHGLDAGFTRKGIEVSPRKENKGWNWVLALSRYGYGSNLRAVTGTDKMIIKDNRIEYHRGDLVEWYINDHRGLEQGFTLNTRPAGQKNQEPLLLQMTSATNLIPEVEKEGKGIIFRNAQGNEVLRYRGLYAFDAAGMDLPAKMTADKNGIRLMVDDHEAVYPIIIDPFIETKKLLASYGAAGDLFGGSVSVSGDTAIVGAYRDDDNGDSSGSAYIFSRNEGGTNNWGQVTKITASDGEAGCRGFRDPGICRSAG